jgi:AhpC/TSA family
MQMTGSKMVLVMALMAMPLIAAAQVAAPAAPAAAPAPGANGPGMGSVAPDFTLPGSTRYGLLRTPVRLADYRGQTVVLAFFYQARTKG